jgi:hypothetical protein
MLFFSAAPRKIAFRPDDSARFWFRRQPRAETPLNVAYEAVADRPDESAGVEGTLLFLALSLQDGDRRQKVCAAAPPAWRAPTHVLFSGGVLNTQLMRERIRAALNAWLAE